MAYKIIQWSSGNVGENVIATVAQRKDLKLQAARYTQWLSGLFKEVFKWWLMDWI